MYLAKITIENFRKTEHLEADFTKSLNVIIGVNAGCKSALIDAIRILYDMGEPKREILVSEDDFHEKVVQAEDGSYVVKRSKKIVLNYEFRDLSQDQKRGVYN